MAPWIRASWKDWALTIVLGLGTFMHASAGSYVAAWGDLGQDTVPAGLTNVGAIACGGFADLAITGDGTVLEWGAVQFSHPAGPANVSSVAAGVEYGLALTTQGQVVAWGDNTYGQTEVPPGVSNVVAIAAGGFHGLALTADGLVAGWGDNSSGQAAAPGALTNVVAVAAGFYHSAALKADGTVTAWGDNGFGQATVPEGLTNVAAIAAGGDHCLALTTDGRVIAWGDNTFGQIQVPAELTNAVAVAAGDYHSLALKADRTLVAWGLAYNGATAVPEGLTNVAVAAAGGSHSVALIQDSPPLLTRPVARETALCGSTVNLGVGAPCATALTFQWFFNGAALPTAIEAALTLADAQTNQSGAYEVVVSDACGLVASSETDLTVVPLLITAPPVAVQAPLGDTVSFSVGAESVATLSYQWRFDGTNLPGATASTLTLPRIGGEQDGSYSVVLSNFYGVVTSASASLSVTVLVEWGSFEGPLNVPAHLGSLIALADGGSDNALMVRADGTVATFGYGSLSAPTNLANIVSVGAGYSHGLALRLDGSVEAWGWDTYGQADVPAGLSNVVAIAAGDFHNLALKADGTVVAWGINDTGETTVPPGLSNVVAISAGSFDSLALRADGVIVEWGRGYAGQTNVLRGLSDVMGAAAGQDHALALRADGTVVAWGDNNFGQTNVPAGLSNVVAVAAGWRHSLALKADGTVVAWGANDGGQTNVPAGLTNVVAVAAGGHTSFALLGPGPPVLRALLTRPKWTPAGFSILVPTQCGRVYGLEYKESLADSGWRALPLAAGNGGLRLLTDPSTNGEAGRFYRVRRW
jgi:alpha-tubulin suppressor-like RCC1 family protein